MLNTGNMVHKYYQLEIYLLIILLHKKFVHLVAVFKYQLIELYVF